MKQLALTHPHVPAQTYLRWFVGVVLTFAACTAVLAPGYAFARCVQTAAAPVLEGTLNLNTATAEQLDLLPGVGPSTAEKIVTYREAHAFRSTKQLLRIKGIGRKTYDRIRPFVVVTGDTTLRVLYPG
jgi:competence ComEA-like helix-hairpin-helix protein